MPHILWICDKAECAKIREMQIDRAVKSNLIVDTMAQSILQFLQLNLMPVINNVEQGEGEIKFPKKKNKND